LKAGASVVHSVLASLSFLVDVPLYDVDARRADISAAEECVLQSLAPVS